jgi:putative endonuclease
MSHGDELVFVEVRMRSRGGFGDGAATVDRRKQNRLVHTAAHYLAHHGGTNSPCRFDVVSVSRPHYRLRLEWIRNAFSP